MSANEEENDKTITNIPIKEGNFVTISQYVWLDVNQTFRIANSNKLNKLTFVFRGN